MGRTIGMGQESGASINITADGKTLTWTVPPTLPDPVRLWVLTDSQPRKLQAQGRGGVETLPWVSAGQLWAWQITAGENDALQAQIQADTRNGFPLTMSVVPVAPQTPVVSVTSAPDLPIPPPGATPEPAPAPAAPSWFEQSMVAGIPNSYLLGGGLLLLLLLSKKK